MHRWLWLISVLAVAASGSAWAEQDLVAKGREIFFSETFGGNGRTCGTCHRLEDNFTIDAAFIATLPDDDPLFVSLTNPDLAEHFENIKLMKNFGLILENTNGFGDLAHNFTMRGVPHVLGLRASIDGEHARTEIGWSGDGAPATCPANVPVERCSDFDGTLRAFALGAVIQHFTKTLRREPGIDFRLPRPDELDALEAFLLSLGRQQDLQLPLPLKGLAAQLGQDLFLDDSVGKCNLCHVNAGATADFGGGNLGNSRFDIGIQNLPDQMADMMGEPNPPDDGHLSPGDGTFDTPPLVEAADTGPFFHNNSISTIEGAVAFYAGAAFNNSPAGRFIAALDGQGVGIHLDATQTVAIAAFLRVINALENIRQTLQLLDEGSTLAFYQAHFEIADAIEVLQGGGLHPKAVAYLGQALDVVDHVSGKAVPHGLIDNARGSLELARDDMIE